jgi:hypothetical protein
MIPSLTNHAQLNPDEKLPDAVTCRTLESVTQHAKANPQTLEKRLAELDHEWNTARLLETTEAAVILGGVGLGVLNVWWLLLSGAAALVLLSHALFGWDPLLPLSRKWRFRTVSEIDDEYYALKVVRGDFQTLTGFTTPTDRDAVSRFEGEGGPAYEGPRTPDASEPHIVQEALAAAKK